MPISAWIVNLPRHHERLAHATARARAVGLEPDVFTAVDGAEHGAVPTTADLSPGEVGCLLSHRRLLQEIAVAPRTGYVLVIEDDVEFSPRFPELLPRVLRAASERGAGLVQVGWIPTEDQLRPAQRLYDTVAASSTLRRVVHLVRPHHPAEPPPLVARDLAWGTHCYLVHTGFADTVRAALADPLHAPVDYYFRALRYLHPERVFRTRFPLAGQDWSFGSSVRPERFAFQHVQITSEGKRERRRVDLVPRAGA
jgi:GR25 family glycosyltransferase involved in LPS biosynthesis